MKKISILLLKLVLAAAFTGMTVYNQNLVWAVFPPIMLWFLAECLDYGAYTFYCNVARFVLPASILPFLLAGLRTPEFHPISHGMYWIVLLMPFLIGTAAAWLFPRLAEKTALQNLARENREIAAESKALEELWGEQLTKRYTARRLIFD
jgi:hypothetical protein